MLDFYSTIERLLVPTIGKYKQLFVITEMPEDPDVVWQIATYVPPLT